MHPVTPPPPPPIAVTETMCLVDAPSSHATNNAHEIETGTTIRSSTMEEEPLPASPIRTLFVSVVLGLVSGTLYGFGRYARALKQNLDISQSQLQQFGIFLDCGNYIGHPLAGIIYDRLGPTVSCCLAALIVFSSYATIHFIVIHKQNEESDDDGLSFHLMMFLEFAFSGVGFGSGLGYMSGLGSTTKQFLSHPKYLGRAVGLVAAGYGMAATLVGLTYQWFGLHQGSSSCFFLFWAISVAVVNLAAAFMFRTWHDQHLQVEEEAHPSTDTNYVIAGERGSSELLSMDHIQHSTDSDSNRENEPWTTWKDTNFWLLFFSFACLTGCGLFVINNVSTMVQSIGASDALAGKLIITLSSFNVAGRIIVGTIGDATNSNKLFLFQMAGVVMAIALLVLGMLSPLAGHERISLALVIVMVAMAYGGSWVLVVAILADLFGKDNFGRDYGLIAMGPALSGMTFNSVSAWFYEQHATSEKNSVCVGVKCYQAAYGVTGISALLGCALLQVVIRNKRQQQR